MVSSKPVVEPFFDDTQINSVVTGILESILLGFQVVEKFVEEKFE